MQRKTSRSQTSVSEGTQERLAQWFDRPKSRSESEATPSIWCWVCDKKTEHVNNQNTDGKMCTDCGATIYDTPIGRLRVWNRNRT